MAQGCHRLRKTRGNLLRRSQRRLRLQLRKRKAAQSSAGNESAAGSSRATSSGIEIVMPQMGESIFEGTITKWLKKVGDTVEKDEPLFEISTDKVDAEIPSPVAGVLTEIKAGEGETVQINAVVAVIGGSGAGRGSVHGPLDGAHGNIRRHRQPQARRRRSWPHRRWWIRIARSDHRHWCGKLRRSTKLICGWCPARVQTGASTRKIFCAT